MDKKKNYISASRMKLLQQCSWKYWARYHLKVPGVSNSGAAMGTVCHNIFELLLKPKHRKHYDKLKSLGSIYKYPPIYRLIINYAKQLDVNNDKNLEMIDKFIQTAINIDFFGPKGTKEVFGEKEFKIEVNEKNKKYSIYGFIDIVYVGEDKKGIFCKALDWKSSKEKFTEAEQEFNIQSVIYQLVMKKLYPNIKDRKLEFIFLAFEKEPRLPQKQLTDQELEGMEFYITNIQSLIDNFDEKSATTHFAANDDYPKPSDGFCKRLLCGYSKYPGHIKPKTGEPYYSCEYKWEKEYYILLDKNKEIIKSSFNEDELKKQLKSDDCKIEKRTYKGCPAWNKENYNSQQQPTEEYSTDF